MYEFLRCKNSIVSGIQILKVVTMQNDYYHLFIRTLQLFLYYGKVC